MSCEHIRHSAYESKDVHVLPCRHKLCINCTCAVTGLMDGDIFSCPICGNFSQYVDPQDKVFGQEKPAGHIGTEDHTNHHRSEPPAVGAGSSSDSSLVSVPADSSRPNRSNAAERDYYTRLENDGITMTEEEMLSAKTICQQREMLAAIQKENKVKKLTARRSHAGSSARQVENFENIEDKAKIDSFGSIDEERVLKLRNDFHPEECLIHKESTNFLCVNCELKLCAQCGSEHNLTYNNHRIEDMGAYSTSDRNDTDYAGNGCVSSTEPSAEANTSKRCVDHHFPFILYCKKCETLLCRECNEKHQRHYGTSPVLPLRDMKNEVYRKSERYYDEIKSKKEKFKEVSEKAEVNIQQVKGQADVLKQKVNTATQEAIDQLLENAGIMIRQIDAETEKVTAKHKAQTESANKNIRKLEEAVDLVQNALKNAEESEFYVAAIAEGEIEKRMKSLDTSCLHAHYGSNEISLECQLNRRLKYSEFDGDRSCAPVRLIKPQYCSTTFAKADSILFQRM